VPVVWDGRPAGLPAGWDDALHHAAVDHEAGRTPNTLCALAAMVRREYAGKGLGAAAIRAMKAAAAQCGFSALIAPVRPTLKSRYPLTPIERYMGWRRADGSAFDPWIRTHERIGGTVVKPAPASMVIEGNVAAWESWTGLALPETGDYVIPDALSPITVDRERDRALYVEPNVWMIHCIR
jgi:GNAT superfamily N-acetyltransferase